VLGTFSKPYTKQKYTGKQECIRYASALIVLNVVTCIYTLFTSHLLELFQFTDHNHATWSFPNTLLTISYENLLLQTTGPTFAMAHNDNVNWKKKER